MNLPSQYHPSYYSINAFPLQPIENYYPSGSIPYLPPYYSSSSFPPDDNLPPSSPIILPQNRANYTRHQQIMLNEIFKAHKYPNSLQKTLIAEHIGVSRDQIRIWFQNKRRKIQLINKGQAKQTKSDIECEYGEYRQHLPNNFLDHLFQELYQARGAPARLPVKHHNNHSNMSNTEQEQQNLIYHAEQYSINYSENMY